MSEPESNWTAALRYIEAKQAACEHRWRPVTATTRICVRCQHVEQVQQ